MGWMVNVATTTAAEKNGIHFDFVFFICETSCSGRNIDFIRNRPRSAGETAYPTNAKLGFVLEDV